MSKFSWRGRWLAGCVAATILCSSTIVQAKSANFTDIEASFAKASINYLYEQGIMEGISSTNFAPKQNINRKQFAVVLAKTWGIQPINPTKPTFSDVGPNQVEYGYVEALVNLGIITGTTPTTFAGDAALTRQDAAVILARALASAEERESQSITNYQDEGQIAPYAKPAVSFVTKQGLMSGHNKLFLPKKALTRAETAVIAHRLLERGNLDGDYFWGVSPTTIELKVGEAEQIKLLSQEALLAYTPVFGLDNPALGKLSPDGLFTATAPGQGLITVNLGQRYHTVMVTVHE